MTFIAAFPTTCDCPPCWLKRERRKRKRKNPVIPSRTRGSTYHIPWAKIPRILGASSHDEASCVVMLEFSRPAHALEHSLRGNGWVMSLHWADQRMARLLSQSPSPNTVRLVSYDQRTKHAKATCVFIWACYSVSWAFVGSLYYTILC